MLFNLSSYIMKTLSILAVSVAVVFAFTMALPVASAKEAVNQHNAKQTQQIEKDAW